MSGDAILAVRCECRKCLLLSVFRMLQNANKLASQADVSIMF